MNINDLINLNLFLPSGGSVQCIEAYIKDSPLEGLGQAWLETEKRTGINAVYLAAHAIHESNFGKSRIAQDKKNIYGFMAYDRNPYDNAKRFNSFEECITYVTDYIKRNYLLSTGKYYNGATLKGINVKYATDKNWSNKVASHMLKMYALKPKDDYSAHPLAATIKEAMALKLMFGYSEGVFKPDQPLTRAEAAAISVRIYHRVLNALEIKSRGDESVGGTI